MNRRELAKNGFLGMCGFLAAQLLPEKAAAKTLMLSTWGTDSNVTHHTYHVTFPAGSNDVPPGREFLNDPEEDGYNDLRC